MHKTKVGSPAWGTRSCLAATASPSGPLCLSSQPPLAPTISSGLKDPKHATAPGVPPQHLPPVVSPSGPFLLASFPLSQCAGAAHLQSFLFPDLPRLDSSLPSQGPQNVWFVLAHLATQPMSLGTSKTGDSFPPNSLKPRVQEESLCPIPS